MGMGFSVFLVAAGAAFYWGTNDGFRVAHVDVAGVILLVVGALGLPSALPSSAPPWRRRDRVARA